MLTAIGIDTTACPTRRSGAPTVCEPGQVEWHLKKVGTELEIKSRDQGI
jgi:hypothetical protein